MGQTEDIADYELQIASSDGFIGTPVHLKVEANLRTLQSKSEWLF